MPGQKGMPGEPPARLRRKRSSWNKLCRHRSRRGLTLPLPLLPFCGIPAGGAVCFRTVRIKCIGARGGRARHGGDGLRSAGGGERASGADIRFFSIGAAAGRRCGGAVFVTVPARRGGMTARAATTAAATSASLFAGTDRMNHSGNHRRRNQEQNNDICRLHRNNLPT